MHSQQLQNYQFNVLSADSPFPNDIIEKLELDEAKNGIVIGICKNKTTHPDGNFYAVLYNGQEPVSVIVMTPPHPAILCMLKKCDNHVMQFLVNAVTKEHNQLPGIIGSKEEVLEFTKQYSRLNNLSYNLGDELRIHQLEKVEIELSNNGKLVKAENKDISLLATWLEEFRKEATPNDPEMSLKTIESEVEKGNFFLWINQSDEIVSIAKKARPTKNTISVNYVYTPQHLRGQGYATAIVSHLSQHLLDQGYRYCVLYTDLANPTSNSIYKKIGYKPVGDVDKYIFT
jgi:predicted GNAT family acetyltransferase